MGRDRLEFFALLIYRTHLPRTASCDSVAYAEGVQKRKAFLFLSFSYFSDRRKVHSAFLLLFGQAKSTFHLIVLHVLFVMQKYDKAMILFVFSSFSEMFFFILTKCKNYGIIYAKV